jgi:hypothetical protein
MTIFAENIHKEVLLDHSIFKIEMLCLRLYLFYYLRVV